MVMPWPRSQQLGTTIRRLVHCPSLVMVLLRRPAVRNEASARTNCDPERTALLDDL